MQTKPIAGSALGQRDVSADSAAKASSGETTPPGPQNQSGGGFDLLLSGIEKEVAARRAAGATKTPSPASEGKRTNSGVGLDGVTRLGSSHGPNTSNVTEPQSSGGTTDAAPQKKTFGQRVTSLPASLWSEIKDSTLRAAGAVGSLGVAGALGVRLAQVWGQTHAINSLPVLGWGAGTAVAAGLGLALFGGLAVRAWRRTGETPSAQAPDGTDGAKKPQGPKKPGGGDGDLPAPGDPSDPTQPQPPPPGGGDGKKGKRKRTPLEAAVVGAAEVGGVAALGFAGQAAFAGAGIAVPPVALGVLGAFGALAVGRAVLGVVRAIRNAGDDE